MKREGGREGGKEDKLEVSYQVFNSINRVEFKAFVDVWWGSWRELVRVKEWVIGWMIVEQ